jgi:hypothetical protein
MQLFVLLMTLLMPFLQPVAQFGANKMQEKLGVPQQQSQPVAMQPMMQGPSPMVRPQPPQYRFDGAKWYKYENGQTYVWNGNGPPQF